MSNTLSGVASAATDAATSKSGLRNIDELNTGTTASNALGKNEFLQILVAQMANQDPLEPASNTEFIAQLAQFSALEQMQNLNASMSTLLANSMIGKIVCVQPKDGSGLIYGYVDGVVTEGGVNYIVVGDEYYTVDQIVAVMDGETQDAGAQLPSQTGLIGMIATATILNEDGTSTTVTGEITKLLSVNGRTYALIDGVQVPVSSITEIVPKAQPAENTEND